MEIYESRDRRHIGQLQYAFSRSPFGEVLTACDDAGLCFAGFVTAARSDALADLVRRFPRAHLVGNPESAVDVFGAVGRLHLVGTDFQRMIWRTLLTVERGSRVSYSRLASMAGCPRAVRAAASAVAANPLSIVVPCHRVVRNDGSTGHYFWGSELKCRLLEAERIPASAR